MAHANTNQRHIQAVLDLASAQDWAEGRTWYSTAHEAAEHIGRTYGVSTSTAAGVIAALSPRNKWERNLIDAEQLISTYVAAGTQAAKAVKVCTFTNNKAKALRILECDGSPSSVRAILSGPKLTEFFNCIVAADDVCIDGHAYAIWFGQRLTLDKVPSIGIKLRRAIKADYVAVAAANGLKPFEAQAITWTAWRRMHGVVK